MDLLDLFVKITVDDSDVDGKLGAAGKSADGFSQKMSAATVALGNLIARGVEMAGRAMVDLGRNSLNAIGELEQNMGGSAAVFGEYAEQMQEKAVTAFSNMGLSASDFLATSNKMGALFQGSGFGIEESATMASDAMQRAADVASIMGIDVSAAMDAVAGAAKGNFTMMDNLGVAINDTTLQQYALAQGITKSTQQMTTQEKVGLAMSLFMEKTAYAAGNYAKENDTLAGSLNTAKAAWDNFISGAGEIDGFVDAAVNAGSIVVDKLTGIVPRLVSGISDMVTKIAPKIPGMVQQLLPALITGAVALLTSAVDILPQMLGILTEAIPLVIGALSDAIPGALPGLVPAVVNVLLLFVSTLTDPGNLTLLTDASIAIIFGLADGLISAVPLLIQQAPVIVSNLVTAIVENAPKLLLAAGELIAQLIIGFGDNFQSMMDAGGEIIYQVLIGINNAYNDLIEAGAQVIGKLWEGMRSAWNNVVSWFRNAFANLTSGLTVNVNANVSGKAAYTGLEYVPYDNYPIIAHKGEAVLTKSEAESWRNGESGGKGSGGITIVQNISAVPQTPVETAAATAAYFEQARWAFA